jgi:hypothetical protein
MYVCCMVKDLPMVTVTFLLAFVAMIALCIGARFSEVVDYL